MNFWNSFWDIIWWFLWIFVFVAYLFALLAIFADLFRDRKLNGWWKAVWVIFLVVVPFITALVYLIARGNGMADRAAEAQYEAKSATDAYIKTVANPNPAAEIAKAKELFDSGTITAGEYESLKSRALAH